MAPAEDTNPPLVTPPPTTDGPSNSGWEVFQRNKKATNGKKAIEKAPGSQSYLELIAKQRNKKTLAH
jgi:hypothetical protein